MPDIQNILFPDNNTGYAYGGSVHDDVNLGHVLKTTNGGKTWFDLDVKMPYITSMHFLNTRVGYLATFNRELYKTQDGGVSWQLINDSINYPYIQLFFFSETEACYVWRNGVYFTKDGGSTWEEIYHDQNMVIQYAKSHNFDSRTIIAIGNNGKILKIKYQ